MAAKGNRWDRQHLSDVERYARRIDNLYRSAVRQAALVGASLIGTPPPGDPGGLTRHPAVRRRIDRLIGELTDGVTAVVLNGVEAQWTLANNKNSELARLVFGDSIGKLTPEQHRQYFSNNDKAREAFTQRREAGLTLSDRVWRYTQQFRVEIELGIDTGLRDGLSADELSRELRQYLQHPDKLFRRVRDKHGVLHLSKTARAFHPGQGVYRSSYKNARRLATTETNIAYRTSDYLRWQQMDFVVGIEVQLSNNHTLNGVPFEDVCDFLKGKYPKDFKFTGWHPHCRCHAVPVLKTEQELARDTGQLLSGGPVDGGSVNTVTAPPEGFTRWVRENADRIAISGYKGTTPYFLKDNGRYVNLQNFQATRQQQFVVDSRREYLRHNVVQWRRSYFNAENGGYLVVDRHRAERSSVSKNERAKFIKEYAMAMVLAQNGYKVEMLKEEAGVPSSDITINGLKADLKCVSSHNNVVKYAHRAIKEQGAEAVVFEFKRRGNDINEAIQEMRRKLGVDIYFYFTGENIVYIAKKWGAK